MTSSRGSGSGSGFGSGSFRAGAVVATCCARAHHGDTFSSTRAEASSAAWRMKPESVSSRREEAATICSRSASLKRIGVTALTSFAAAAPGGPSRPGLPEAPRSAAWLSSPCADHRGDALACAPGPAPRSARQCPRPYVLRKSAAKLGRVTREPLFLAESRRLTREGLGVGSGIARLKKSGIVMSVSAGRTAVVVSRSVSVRACFASSCCIGGMRRRGCPTRRFRLATSGRCGRWWLRVLRSSGRCGCLGGGLRRSASASASRSLGPWCRSGAALLLYPFASTQVGGNDDRLLVDGALRLRRLWVGSLGCLAHAWAPRIASNSKFVSSSRSASSTSETTTSVCNPSTPAA
jgi:hypothetical protein